MSLIRFIISLWFITPCTNIWGDLWIFVELGFPSIEFLFVSFANKPYLLCVSTFVSVVLCWVVLCCVVLYCVVLCCVYFLPFSVSRHLPFIFTCWPDVGCNIGYGTAREFVTGCQCVLACWYVWWVFMELPDPVHYLSQTLFCYCDMFMLFGYLKYSERLDWKLVNKTCTLHFHDCW
jgi:hypothetical protein